MNDREILKMLDKYEKKEIELEKEHQKQQKEHQKQQKEHQKQQKEYEKQRLEHERQQLDNNFKLLDFLFQKEDEKAKELEAMRQLRNTLYENVKTRVKNILKESDNQIIINVNEKKEEEDECQEENECEENGKKISQMTNKKRERSFEGDNK